MNRHDSFALRVFAQHHWPPFLPFCAMGERIVRGVRYVVNAEGRTPDEALASLRKRIDEEMGVAT
jgi:hypothetical protein